jgi:hypothetical protein
MDYEQIIGLTILTIALAVIVGFLTSRPKPLEWLRARPHYRQIKWGVIGLVGACALAIVLGVWWDKLNNDHRGALFDDTFACYAIEDYDDWHQLYEHHNHAQSDSFKRAHIANGSCTMLPKGTMVVRDDRASETESKGNGFWFCLRTSNDDRCLWASGWAVDIAESPRNRKSNGGQAPTPAPTPAPAQAASPSKKMMYPDFYAFEWGRIQCVGEPFNECKYGSCERGYRTVSGDYAGVMTVEGQQVHVVHKGDNYYNVDDGNVLDPSRICHGDSCKWSKDPAQFQINPELREAVRKHRERGACLRSYEPPPE